MLDAFMTNPLLVISLLVSFAAYPAYAYGITRQGMRPTRPTWIMILVSDLLLFAFMLKEGRWDWLLLGFTAGNVLMLVLMARADVTARTIAPVGAGSTAVLPPMGGRERLRLLLLGRDIWTKKDIASVVVALGALALYKLSGSGTLAICFSLVGKIAASVPMWLNLWKEPHREQMLPWALWLVGGILYVASIPQSVWSFASLATPVVFVILEALVLLLLARRYLTSPNGAPVPQVKRAPAHSKAQTQPPMTQPALP